MENRWDILVVSGRFENKRMLLRILYDLPVFVFTASTIRQAHEVLASRPIRLLFCEENFADGSYRDLLYSIHSVQPSAQLVLMLSTGEWNECLEAMSLGAREVIRCPLQPTDIELVLIRAARESVSVFSHDDHDEKTSSPGDPGEIHLPSVPQQGSNV